MVTTDHWVAKRAARHEGGVDNALKLYRQLLEKESERDPRDSQMILSLRRTIRALEDMKAGENP